MSRLDEKASEWLDGRLADAERADFQRELEADPEKAREAKDLGRVIEALKSLEVDKAPPDLLKDVQRRIRRRSHGRHYAASWRQRLPFEALVTGLLVLVMVAVYLWAGPAQSPQLAPVSPKIFQGAGTGTGLASSVLSYYGAIVGEQLSSDGTNVRLTVEVPAESLDALRREVALYPQLELEGEPSVGPSAETVRVQVRARR